LRQSAEKSLLLLVLERADLVGRHAGDGAGSVV